MYDQDVESNEHNYLLMKKYGGVEVDENGNGQEYDAAMLFELNLAHNLASIQKQSLTLIDEDDSVDETLYKHHLSLRRIKYNLDKFKTQLEDALVEEEERERHLLTSTQLYKTQNSLFKIQHEASLLQKSLQFVLNEAHELT